MARALGPLTRPALGLQIFDGKDDGESMVADLQPRAVFEVLFDLSYARKRLDACQSLGGKDHWLEQIRKLENELTLARAAQRGCGQ